MTGTSKALTHADHPASSGVAALPVARRRRIPTLGLQRFSGIYAYAVVVLIFGLWVPDLFLRADTFKSILTGDALTAMMALGVLVPLAAGAYDLSIASVMTLAVVAVALFQSKYHMPFGLAVLLTVLIAVSVGVVNGFAVVVMRINSFIATLASSSILAAITLWISGGEQIVTGISTRFISLGQNDLFGIALPVFYMLGLAILLYLTLEHTPFGRYLFAVGDNAEATRLAGIRTGRLTFAALVVSATISGVAGIILCARIGSASLDAGTPYLLPAFAAAFLGSTQLRPGRMNVWGTVLAVYLLATGIKGLQLVGAASWVSPLFYGVALMVAVAAAMAAPQNRKVT